MYTYEKHCEEMKQRGHNPMSKKHFQEMQVISDEPIIQRLEIRPKKDARKIHATFKNYVSKQ